MTPTPAARWFIAAGASTNTLYREWNRGAAAEVPTGQLWDVVRVTTRLGHDVLRQLDRIGAEIGPVLATPARGALEFWTPTGTAANWPQLIGTRATSRGYVLCPPPHMNRTTGLRSTGARQWIIPPLYAPATTDADALCEAVAASLLTLATAVLATAGWRQTA